ncbi:MAG: PhzF family phenazine biosynthesis protein [bacterium]
MASRRLMLIDAFTDRPFTGNPAGVVLDAGDLESGQMQAIAREVNASETAFVCGGGEGDPYRVRFFTPTDEVPLCGHATVATFHALVWEGRIPTMEGEVVVQQETNSGLLPLRLAIRDEGLQRILMGQQPPLQDPYRGELETLAGPLGVPLALLEEGDEAVGPPARVSTGLKCLHVALPDRSAVEAASPDFRALRQLSRELDVTTVQILTLEAGGDAHVHVRTFAPAVGVDEDPVTGTAAGSLGGYLAYINYLPEMEGSAGGGKARFGVTQGEEMGRPGRVEVELQMVGQSVTEVWVGGKAVPAFEGTIRDPRV